jgi:hypothetical protein
MANPMPPEELERHSAILDRSSNRAAIAASARALAASEDDAALLNLGRRLRSAEFLDRLDDTSQPGSDIENLAFVFTELTFHPTPSSARLCELLYDEPDFAALPVRLNFLLTALAAVVPTTEEGANVFRRSSAVGFAEVNGPLLIQNQSPLALQVFEEIIAGDWVATAAKVEILHRSVLPRRTDKPVLETCIRLLENNLATPVRDAIIETLYDYQPGPWFGPVRHAPRPPQWESASTEVLRTFLSLAERLRNEGLNEPLQSAVRATSARIESILTARSE